MPVVRRRAEVDVIRVARSAQEALEARNIPLQVAVMGCVVNGPGEARDAPTWASRPVAARATCSCAARWCVSMPESEMVGALLQEAELIVEEGIDARLPARTRGGHRGRPRELLQVQGVDVNHSGTHRTHS